MSSTFGRYPPEIESIEPDIEEAAAPEAAAAQRPSERSTLRGCPSIGHDDAKVHRPAASRSARPQRRSS